MQFLAGFLTPFLMVAFLALGLFVWVFLLVFIKLVPLILVGMFALLQ
jgi:hypothetical protein